jgi:hypothetical protein
VPRVRDVLGITDDEYADLLDVSDHLCWICRQPEGVEGRRLAVDHDHRTGAVRGLLCTKCNRRLGGCVSPEWLYRAAVYLAAASLAFGDLCDTCGELAPSTLVDADAGTFRYECCGERWTVSYATRGVPMGWKTVGVPVPDHPPVVDQDATGCSVSVPAKRRRA